MRGAAYPSFAALLLALVALPAHAIYRCEMDGRVLYSDMPCDGGRPVDITLAPPAEDAQERAVRDRETLARMEKETARQTRAESKEHRRREREQAALQRRCEKLEMRARWTAADARKSTGDSSDKASRKAERAHEQYRAECAKLNKPGGLIGISSR